MRAFERLTAIAAPLNESNVDTDRIIPARFLRKPRDTGYGQFLFHDARQRPDFTLNDPAYADAQILVTGENFGCGSSREGAVWALMGGQGGPLARGVRVVIAPSFGDIFHNNALRNGLLAIRLPAEVVVEMRRHLVDHPGATIEVDLRGQSVVGPGDQTSSFEIDPFLKECILRGLDDIEMTLESEPALVAFETRRRATVPWLF